MPESETHAEDIMEFAIDMLRSLEDFNRETRNQMKVRIGIHSGPVIAGLVGVRKLTYDILGSIFYPVITCRYRNFVEFNGISWS